MSGGTCRFESRPLSKGFAEPREGRQTVSQQLFVRVERQIAFLSIEVHRPLLQDELVVRSRGTVRVSNDGVQRGFQQEQFLER